MSFEIIYTDNFRREVKQLNKKHRSLKSDLEFLIGSLEENPLQGTSLGRDCYKIRIAITSKSKGKSGGARVITHIYVANKVVYLLSIFDKSEQENITDKELQSLLRLIQ